MSSITKPYTIRRQVPCLLALIALLLSLDTVAADLDARLDRTRVAEGETVVLSLTAPGDAAGAPNPDPLEGDFDLLDQKQSTRMSIINGRSSSIREWQWVLAPRRTGKLTIPAIRLGGNTTKPLTLEVLPAAQAAKLGKARPVMLEVEAKPEQPFVQGQVTYKVRVLSRVPLLQASLSEPRAGDAIVERLGDDRQYTTDRDGEQYRVIERRYAVFPQHSGKLEIETPVLSAQIPEQGQRRGSLRERLFGRDPFAGMDSFFGSEPFADMGSIFGQTRPVHLRARSVELAVKPQPPGAASPWLPAESLELAETWSPDPPVFRVGEPVTRTIAITSQGLTAAQLPDLQPPTPAGVKIYPDKAQLKTRAEGDTLVAQKVLKSALVPSRAGELRLPEVRLPWWDTRTGESRVARLPGLAVTILPAAPGVSTAASAAADQGAGSVAGTSAPAARAQAAPEPLAAGSRVKRTGESWMGGFDLGAGYWPWLAALLALGWLASTILWVRARAAGPVTGTAAAESAPPAPDPSKFVGAVKKACNADDARAARRALLAWAAAGWPEGPPERLETLAPRLGGEAAEILRELDRVLYAQGSVSWDGAAAWQRLAPLLGRDPRVRDREGRDSPLPPLYPETA